MTRPVEVAVRSTLHESAVVAALRTVDGIALRVAGSADALVGALAGADVLVISPGNYDGRIADTIRSSGTLRHMHLLSSGRDRVDLFGALPESVLVTNSAEAIGPSVAEHAMALVLGLVRQLHGAERARAAGRWARDALLSGLGSIDGARLTLVGFGAIGTGVARRAEAFGSRVTVVRRNREAPARHYRVRALDEALPDTDVLVLALPLSPETRHLIDARRLAMLPPGALVVNVGRGGLIDTQALQNGLRSGRIGGAGLDVFEEEPLPDDSPLWALPNVILTPHLAGFGHPDMGGRIARHCVRTLCREQGLPEAAG